MGIKRLSFLNTFIVVINIISALPLLLACVVPYTTSASFSFLSLIVPVLVIVNACFFIYWLLKKRRIAWLSASVLVIGYFALGSFIEFKSDSNSGVSHDLTILSYNSMGFGGYLTENRKETTKSIRNFINAQRPEIICFQEYDWRMNKYNQFIEYPYQFFFDDEKKRVRQAILSKFPIVNEGSLQFPKSFNNGIFADVIVGTDTIRIYNLHLESLKVRPGMIQTERSDRLLKRLRNSFAKQHEQALIFRKNAEECPYKKIVCVDLNNTQFSSAYRIIKGDMNDSFAEEGSGYGKTINFWHFPLRIDFILADTEIKIIGHKNYSLGYSDHEPVMASFKLSSDE